MNQENRTGSRESLTSYKKTLKERISTSIFGKGKLESKRETEPFELNDTISDFNETVT